MKTFKADANGDGVYEKVHTETTVNNLDGSRGETAADTGANGALIGMTSTWTSADSRSKIVDTDHACDGTYDQRVTSAIAVNAAGAVTTTNTTR